MKKSAQPQNTYNYNNMVDSNISLIYFFSFSFLNMYIFIYKCFNEVLFSCVVMPTVSAVPVTLFVWPVRETVGEKNRQDLSQYNKHSLYHEQH